MRIGRRFPLVAWSVTLAALFVVPSVASGSPVDDKRAQAARLQDQIDANGEQISALGEQYNGARLELTEANAAIVDAERRMESAQAQTNDLTKLLSERAATLYKTAGSDIVNSNGGTESSLGVMKKYASAAASKDTTLIAQLRDSKEALQLQRERFAIAKREAEEKKSNIDASRRSLEQLNANQRALLAQTKGELAALVVQEQARREAEARRKAAAEQERLAAVARARGPEKPSGAPAKVAFPDVPAPSPGAAAAIQYARQQIGKRYVYAAAGPNSFDCSGLTMMAWRAGGVSMPHYSGAQFRKFPRIPFDELQPGDLVFKGPGGSAHVALYVGNGMQIAATQTGDFVKLQPVPYGRLSGAARPG